jgi:large subunit ribosomal protein L25
VSDLVMPEGIKVVKHGSQNPVVVSVADPVVEEEIVVAPVAAEEKGKGKGKAKK